MKLSHGPNTRKTLEELIDSALDIAMDFNPDEERTQKLLKHLEDIQRIGKLEIKNFHLRENHIVGARNKIAKTLHVLRAYENHPDGVPFEEMENCIRDLFLVLLYLDPEILINYK